MKGIPAQSLNWLINFGHSPPVSHLPTADIEKTFLMVSISEEDRYALRFLWVDSVTSDQPRIRVLRFTRVVFGVTSSPFLLNAMLHSTI